MTESISRLLELQHVTLPISAGDEALAEGRRFYGEILGLTEVLRPTVFQNTGVWFAVGGQELHLSTEPSGAAANDQSRRHPCFRVEDVDALRRHLNESGVTTLDDDGTIPGRPRFFALDPFGNTLEFVRFDADHW
jgi:catechol 2,3-dioxygenase-like lactoylglutathione lyase family enzyme